MQEIGVPAPIGGNGIRIPDKLRADEELIEGRRTYAPWPLSVCALVRQPHIDGLLISRAVSKDAG